MSIKLGRGMAAALFAAVCLAPLLPAPASAQNDSCQWAFDGECDEPGIGTGVCAYGTDTSDCYGGPAGPNSCQYAYDGECDHPGTGTGLCVFGTDTADCSVSYGDYSNSCQHAYDGECDHPGVGTGACSPGTDVADCSVRAGPNSCRYAFDGECDHPGIGTGACPAGTDIADCRAPASGYVSPNMVYTAQVYLNRLGYNAGPADGVIGPRTRAAIRRFQRDYGLPVTGQVSQQLLNTLGNVQ